MSTVEKINIFSDGEDTSTNCMYLVVITNGEIKKRISFSKAAMANLTNIIQNLEVPTNKKLRYCIQVFPVVL
jgi:hypothetical protein